MSVVNNDWASGSNTPKIVVGSGWWSAGIRSQWNIGDDLIRSRDFFALWHRQVMRSFDPALIVVTDSKSPIKPEIGRFDRVTWIELDRNYGHSNDIRVGLSKTKFSGATRSRVMGAMYALCCDADFFVHVEQDCLVKGEAFIKAAIGAGEFDFYCGQRVDGGMGLFGRAAAAMLQNSVLIVKKSGLENFIAKTISAPEVDGKLASELKMERDIPSYGLLAMPYGRSRPIDFSLAHLYAQHLSQDELRAFVESEGLQFDDWFPPIETRIDDTSVVG